MHDEVDQILNEGLASYTAVDPPPARLWGELQLARSFSSARWMTATAALAAAAALIAFFLLPSEPPRLTVAAIRTPSAPPIMRSVPLSPPRKHPRTAAIKPAPAPPKLDQFPSPVPLTREEAALIAVARNHPEQLAALAGETKPIEIQEIQIAPLDPDGNKETRQ